MEEITKLLDQDSLEQISRAAGDGIEAGEVAQVLSAVLPGVEEEARSGELCRRVGEAERGSSAANVLSLLLGSGSVSGISQSSGVNQSKVSRILKIVAPLLLALLLQDSGSQSSGNNNAGGLLSLLADDQPQPQTQSNAGDLLGALLGGGQSQPSGGAGSLLGSFVSLLADDGRAAPAAKKPAAKKTTAAKKPAAKKNTTAKKPAAAKK